MDLDEKLIIKVQLNDEIRKMPIHNEEITYDELIIMMERVFKHKLSQNDEINIKYRDEDNDLITISDDSDLSFAIESSKVLKLVLNVVDDDKEELKIDGKSINTIDLNVVKAELQSIRDRSNKLLDLIGQRGGDIEDLGQQRNTGSNLATGDRGVGGKEFDPLSISNLQLTEKSDSSTLNQHRQEDNIGKNVPPPMTSVSSAPSSQSMNQPPHMHPSVAASYNNTPPSTIGLQQQQQQQQQQQHNNNIINNTPQNFIGQNMPPQHNNITNSNMPPVMTAPSQITPNLPPPSNINANLGGHNMPPSSFMGYRSNTPPQHHLSNSDQSAAAGGVPPKMPGQFAPEQQKRPQLLAGQYARPALYPPGIQTRPSFNAPPSTLPGTNIPVSMPGGQQVRPQSMIHPPPTSASYFNPSMNMQQQQPGALSMFNPQQQQQGNQYGGGGGYQQSK